MTRGKTIGETAQLWQDDRKRYVKLSTISAYALIIRNHIIPHFGNRRCVMENEIQEFALKKMDEGLGRKSVRDILTVLRMILKFGHRHKMLRCPEWSVRFPSGDKVRTPVVLDRRDQRKLMEYICNHVTVRIPRSPPQFRHKVHRKQMRLQDGKRPAGTFGYQHDPESVRTSGNRPPEKMYRTDGQIIESRNGISLKTDCPEII